MKIYILAGYFSVAVLTAAEAKCMIPAGYPFFLDQNDTVTYNPLTDAKGCNIYFRAGGAVEFTSASIVSPAKNGKFTQTGAFNFQYAPKVGFKGQDTYSVKVCGKTLAGSGCSTINYQTTVE